MKIKTSSIPKTVHVDLDAIGSKYQSVKVLASIGIAGFLGFVLAITGYAVAMQHRVLYGVSLGGIQYGSQPLTSLGQTVQAQIDRIEHQPLSIANTTSTTTLADLDIHLDTAQAVRDIALAGREGSFGTQLRDSFSLLVKPTPIAWSVTTTSATAGKLKQSLAGTLQQGHDASFALVDDVVTITSEQVTTDLDLPATLSHIRTSFLRGTPTVLYVQTATQAPTVTRSDLLPLLSQVTAQTKQAVVVINGSKTATASRAELLHWLQPRKQTDGQLTLDMNNEAVTTWLHSVAPSFNTAAIAAQVSATDKSVLRAGRDGTELDSETTSHAIVTAMQAADASKPVTIQAAMVTVSAPTQTITPAMSTTPGLYAGKYVEVDLSSQMFYQYEGTQLIHSYRISSGKSSTPTPIGTYHILDKAPMAYSAAAGLYMPYWMPFIGSTYGLHALPVWPNGHKEGENHLGTPVSHGCVRLSTSAAAVVYDWIEIGTPVVIHR